MHDALGDGQWERAKLRLPSEEIVPEHGVMNDCEIDHEPPDIGRGKYVMHYIRKADFGMPRLAFLLCRVCLTDGVVETLPPQRRYRDVGDTAGVVAALTSGTWRWSPF
jgi:hypothetical protein